MTLEIDGMDVLAMAQAGLLVGGLLVTLMAGLILYLMVRPPRHVREPRTAEPDAIENEELAQLMDRMQARLEVLERALADAQRDRAPRSAAKEQLLTPAGLGRDSGRME